MTRKLFHEELDEIRSDVIRLGALAGEAVERGARALLDADLNVVGQVQENDEQIDALTHAIEQHTYLLLAQQQPMAVDLRMLVTVLRVIHEIERIGDLMVKVAKTTRRLYPYQLEPRVRGIIDQMRGQAVSQLRLAVEAFADADAARASALPDMDDVMDELQKDLFAAIFSTHAAANDEAVLHHAVAIALVGRHFERIGDHAANVAERVQFMVTGHFPFEVVSG